MPQSRIARLTQEVRTLTAKASVQSHLRKASTGIGKVLDELNYAQTALPGSEKDAYRELGKIDKDLNKVWKQVLAFEKKVRDLDA